MSDDRTSEFLSLASSLRGDGATTRSAPPAGRGAPLVVGGGGGGGAPSRTTPLRAAAYEELRTFHRNASEISADISHTSDMLAELTRLVRARALFMDDSERVNELVSRVKSSVENLNARLEESGKVIRQQKRRLGETSQAGQEADNVVHALREDFARATTGFKAVLQKRSDWMKERAERERSVFGGGATGSDRYAAPPPLTFAATKPPVYGADGSSSKDGVPALDLTSGLRATVGESASDGVVCAPYAPALRHRGGYAPLDLTNGTTTTTHNNHHMLTPLEMQRLDEESGNAQALRLIPDQNYLRERADAMTTVESNIVELGTIFNKLAVMVNEHQEVVQRLGDNVADADRNVTLSMETLTRTLTDLQTNRALFGKVVGILVIFIVLFITFFA